MNKTDRAHLYSVYFAPRGRERLLRLGEELSQQYLSYSDKLIGIVGDAGSGKSLIIKGMFPGLCLSNDDDSIDANKIMRVRNNLDEDYKESVYHLDMRFQVAFTQMFEIVDFVRGALKKGRRVVIEHFDLLFDALGINADILFGIGDEIIVTRPNMFGPIPKDIYDIVFHSLKNRKMTHTAEDIVTMILAKNCNIPNINETTDVKRGDVRRGFLLYFKEKLDIDIKSLEKQVKDLIAENRDISYYDENHIKIGEDIMFCTGPRIHVRNTSEINDFKLLYEFKYDAAVNMYALVGFMDEKDVTDLSDLNRIRRERYS